MKKNSNVIVLTGWRAYLYTLKHWIVGDRKGLRAFFHWKVQLLIWATLFILAMIING